MDVLVAAGGAAWEAGVVRDVEHADDLRLLRRCVDVPDLLAAARTTSAALALVAPDLPGLDVDVVGELTRAGVEVVVVGGAGARERADALAVTRVVEPSAVTAVAESAPSPSPQRSGGGRVWAVWGPTGAPGRTTVALALASGAAARGLGTVLVDADTYGGAVAQSAGILDDVSGLMAACRAATHGRTGEIDEHLLELEPRLRVLTGLPRPDLWPQLRPAALEAVLRHVSAGADVTVIDCGFCVEAADGARGRNRATEVALAAADEVVVVGRADPVGLSRLVRALHDLADATGRTDPVVVVNQMRPGLGWREDEVRRTLARLTATEPRLFLPWDQASLDAAAMTGRTPRVAAPASPFVARVEQMVASLASA